MRNNPAGMRGKPAPSNGDDAGRSGFKSHLQHLEVGEFVLGFLRSFAIARNVLIQAIPVRVIRGLVAACLALAWATAFAQGAGSDPSQSFDHASTGFSLSSQHALARCESCHIQGVFRGTPRDCASCHRNASRPMATQFPVRHIPTTQPCDTCHRAAAWNVVIYRHQGVTRGSCLTCHTGAFATGKPAQHVATTASCDTCHNTLIWTATTYDHSGVAAGTCANCHNGVTATGKPARHVPTTASCDTCHTTILWRPAIYPHDATTTGQCSTCHNNVTALGKSAAHIPDNRQCDTCHTSTISFRIRVMNHSGLNGQCSNCHSGAYVSQNAVAKPATHVPTTAQCDTCHTTVAWRPASFSHNASMAGTCATCHNGVTATGKNTGHIPTSAQCDTCHASTISFLGAVMNHTGLAGQCSNCHNGTYLAQNAQAKPASHVATTQQCDTCHHSTTSWATVTFNHSLATPPVFIGDHSCANCHKSGGPGLSKPTTHIPTNVACDTCHTNFLAFKPANMDHTGTSGQCSSCHNGTYVSVGTQGALAKPTTHIPTSLQCDTCHTNFVAFRPAAMNHTGTNGACSTCHSGAYVAVGALAKTATHVPTTAQCDSCHTTSAWRPASYVHDATATRRCSVCHNGVTAPGKGGTHIPDNRQCDTCHTNYTAFRPALMNHTGLAGQCSTCHNGAYLSENAQAKSATHIATTAQCDTCHFSTVTWATATVDHARFTPPVVIGDHTCANCHKSGGTGLPKPTNHIPTSGACDTCHTNFVAFRPAYMDHTGTAGTCSTCHNGTYVSAGTQGALAKPLTHIPTSTQCDSCHTNFVAFRPAVMNHTGTNGQCSTCHNGAYVSVGSQGALAKPATHIATTAQCDTCHTTTAWTPATGAHDASSPGRCSNCHNGISALGKNAGHIPTASQCDTCHNNYVAFRPAAMNHAGLAGQCSNCHNGAYVAQNALTKSANHVPTTAQCDSSGCHTSTTSWATVTFNHATYTPPITIGSHTCANAGCHVAGGTGLPKPANHIATTQACDVCHRNFTAFSPATMDHTGITGQCDSCHNGTNATGKPAGRHIPTTQSCNLCHRTTAWLPLLTPYSHTGVAAGTCVTCHSAPYANIDVKPVSHIPTTFACDQCHRTTAWLPPITPYSHTGVAAGTCATCHTAPYTDIVIKTGNHIPTSLSATWSSCDACHKSYTSFANARIHRTVFTSVSSYPGTCLTCHYRGNPYGVRQPPNDTRHTRAPGNGSCDQSGCHRSVTGF